MSTFEQSRGLFNQTHFTVIEIDVPVVEGVCTIGGEPGFGTPLSCDQPSNAVRTYKFTQEDAPLLPESGIYRQVTRISETPAKLNTGRGLASRGTGSISLRDFSGKDPNPDAPAVNSDVINQGSFIAKLNARNQLANRELRIKNYRIESDGSIDLGNGAQTRHYIIDSIESSKNSTWSIKFKDELSRINIGESVWPIPLEGFVRTDIDESVTTIPVDANVNYLVGDTVRSGDELMKVIAVDSIGAGTAKITVEPRGTDIAYTNTLSKTLVSSHSAGDELFVCEVSDDERIDDLLERILLDIGIEQSYIPKSEWASEIDEWHPSTRVNTLWYESEDTSKVLESILTYFLIDMWFDPVAREIKLSAISVWKQSSQTIEEGNQINYESVTKRKEENLRATRALVVYDKRYLASTDSVENFNKASIFRRTEVETTDFFGEPKTKRFELSRLLSKDAADLLVQRWVSRYINPASYSFVTPERKLTFNTGDVVDANVLDEVGFNGLSTASTRMQITSIKPNYTNLGRDYTVNGLSYEPVFAEGSEIVISGNISDINLYIQYAGAPSQPVELTFIFDGVTAGSTASDIPAIRAGAFPDGSKLVIILVNDCDLKAKGGNGGNGGGIVSNGVIEQPQDGENGSTVFDAEGVDCDIYLSGATPSAAYPNADGKIFAPSGGDGGFDLEDLSEIGDPIIGGNGGNGGNGRFAGLGGQGGVIAIGSIDEDGERGLDGKESGSPNEFGLRGNNNNAFGGDPGKGVVDNGGIVNLFGVTTSNYVNGGGDH